MAPGPRSPSPNPVLSKCSSCSCCAGSDHSKSLDSCLICFDRSSIARTCTANGQGILLMLSSALSVAESGRGMPPCTQKITSSMVAAKGRQSNTALAFCQRSFPMFDP